MHLTSSDRALAAGIAAAHPLTPTRCIRATGNPLSAESLRDRYQYDPRTGEFLRRVNSKRRPNALVPAGWINKTTGYAELRIDGVCYKAHRLAWLYVYGEWPTEVDHINRSKSDNRIANLREVTRAQNMQNAVTGPKSRTGVRGVAHHPASGKFAAYISRDNKKVWLGVHDTIEQAAVVRRAAERGEQA